MPPENEGSNLSLLEILVFANKGSKLVSFHFILHSSTDILSFITF